MEYPTIAVCWVLAPLDRLPDDFRLIGELLYGSGLRLSEALSLRVKDIDFARHQLMVKRGKSAQDRPALLPAASEDALRRHVEWLAQRHAAELKAGFGEGDVPDALARKIPSAARSLGWQYVLLGLVGVVSPLDR